MFIPRSKWWPVLLRQACARVGGFLALTSEVMAINGLDNSAGQEPFTALEMETSPPCAHSVPKVVPEVLAALDQPAPRREPPPDLPTKNEQTPQPRELPGLMSIKSRVAVRCLSLRQLHM